MLTSLRARLLLLCTILCLVTVTVGAVGVYSLRTTVSRYDHVASINLPHTLFANLMLSNMRRIRIGLRTVALPHISPEEAKDAIDKAEESLDIFEKTQQDYLSTEYSPGVQFGPGEKELYDEVEKTWEAYKKVAKKAIELYRTGRPEDYEKVIQIFFHDDPKIAKINAAALEKLISYQSDEASNWVKLAKQGAQRSIMICLIMIVIGLIAGMSIGLVFATRLSKSIAGISQDIASGTDKLSSVAQQIATASQSLSQNTTEQAAAIQETSASVEETSQMIGQNAENANQSTELSTKSQTIVSQAREAVGALTQSIDEISATNDKILKQIEESNKEISDIVKLIEEIGAKTNIINDIVFQTKLLSFNASVEAARAGEHGKGFAVVAEEVGNLAKMSGSSADEIRTMLENSKKQVEQTVTKMKTQIEQLLKLATSKVQAGTETAKKCNDILNEVVDNSTKVNERIAEIAAASREQSHGVNEINKAMVELDKASQLNRQATEQTFQSADVLKNEVVELRSMVQRLNDAIYGINQRSS